MPSCGQWRSCVPQPSSAGCSDSPTNAPLDQVLTNSPHCLRLLPTWRSRSAICMTLTPSSMASRAQPSLVVGASPSVPAVPGEVEQGLLDEMRDQPGVGAVHQHHWRALRVLLAHRQRRFAERVVDAARSRDRGVAMAARPGLDARVQVHDAALAAVLDEREAGHVEGSVEQEIAGLELAIEDAEVVVAGQRLDPEGDAILLARSRAPIPRP